jgi:hypothetical protein
MDMTVTMAVVMAGTASVIVLMGVVMVVPVTVVTAGTVRVAGRGGRVIVGVIVRMIVGVGMVNVSAAHRASVLLRRRPEPDPRRRRILLHHRVLGRSDRSVTGPPPARPLVAGFRG